MRRLRIAKNSISKHRENDPSPFIPSLKRGTKERSALRLFTGPNKYFQMEVSYFTFHKSGHGETKLTTKYGRNVCRHNNGLGYEVFTMKISGEAS